MRKLIMSFAALAVSTGVATAQEISVEDETIGLFGAIAENRVDIKGGVFFPPVILASAGDTIVFSNDEDVTHDVTAKDDSWTTGEISPGGIAEVLVTADMVLCFKSTTGEAYVGAFGSTETGEAPACYEGEQTIGNGEITE